MYSPFRERPPDPAGPAARGRPSHGYELKRDYDALFAGGKPLSFGQVYGTLARLERDGQVAGEEAEPGTGPTASAT